MIFSKAFRADHPQPPASGAELLIKNLAGEHSFEEIVWFPSQSLNVPFSKSWKDLNEMKNRLSAMQSKQSGKGGGEKKSVFWKPSVGKQVIRVVPSKYNKKNPFNISLAKLGLWVNLIL